jgi:hypothetical protein
MRLRITIFLLFLVPQLYAQTCCTAGAPVSNFYGIQGGEESAWVMNLSYEHKSINLLIDENERLLNDPRTRSGQSISAKVDYILNRKWSFSAALPLIIQSRETISSNENSLGFGDLLLVSQYRLMNKKSYTINISGGLKIPLGQNDHRGEALILLSPDMQSGSGSLDWVARVNFTKEYFLIPFLNSAIEFSYRDNGINSFFGSTQNFSGRRFGFGDELVSLFSINYQWITSKGFYIPDVSIKFRKSGRNIEQNAAAPNSGGTWWSLPIGFSFQPDERKSMRIYAELPLYQDLNGLQISTSFTAGVQLRYVLSKPNRNTDEIKI